jgi:orotate phosphoribosyltransferase
MIYNNKIASEVAEYLLEIKAVELSPENPFTWASGLKSPIYCDNRKILSFPKVRHFIKKSFVRLISDKFPSAEVIAGVATAGIPHGVLIAEELSLPFIYVRDKPKTHGLENRIEGVLESGKKVLVIEDLISTGGSSLKAVEAVREAGGNVMGLGAIFTYGFTQADEAFQDADCEIFTLSNYIVLLETALRKKYISPSQHKTLSSWYQQPETWFSNNI